MNQLATINYHFCVNYPEFRLAVKQQLPSQGVTVLFGHSGSGKSTLLRCIAGLERAEHAFLQVNEEIWDDSSRHLHRPTYQRPIGYVFQETSLFPHLNVRNNLEFGRKRSRFIRSPQGLEQAIELLGIGHLLQRMPSKLSGGEKQRVAIARALAVCPQLLLMDEPLAALDLQRKQEILPFLTRLHSELEIPVLYVTHSPQEVTRLADHIVMLKAGKVISSGPLETTLPQLDSPLADSRQASSILRTQVDAYDAEYHLLQVSFAGGSLSLPSPHSLPLASSVRVRIYARDISLTLQRPQHSSILNILPATIRAMQAGEAGQMIVQLQLGEALVLAHITLKSARQLRLQAGMPVYAQIKATAIV